MLGTRRFDEDWIFNAVPRLSDAVGRLWLQLLIKMTSISGRVQTLCTTFHHKMMMVNTSQTHQKLCAVINIPNILWIYGILSLLLRAELEAIKTLVHHSFKTGGKVPLHLKIIWFLSTTMRQVLNASPGKRLPYFTLFKHQTIRASKFVWEDALLSSSTASFSKILYQARTEALQESCCTKTRSLDMPRLEDDQKAGSIASVQEVIRLSPHWSEYELYDGSCLNDHTLFVRMNVNKAICLAWLAIHTNVRLRRIWTPERPNRLHHACPNIGSNKLLRVCKYDKLQADEHLQTHMKRANQPLRWRNANNALRVHCNAILSTTRAQTYHK